LDGKIGGYNMAILRLIKKQFFTFVVVILGLTGWIISTTCIYGETVRLKDIAHFSGVRKNQLIGYGLVIGLSGTGDKRGAEFTTRSIANMLENMGIKVDPTQIQPKNVAAVIVSAEMPVSAKPGDRLDVTVSSIGDASSLLGGVLLLTPLKGIDGKVYALAQGPLLLGGYSVGGQATAAVKNIPTVAKIPGGAIVERSTPFEFNSQDKITISLEVEDFSTTQNIAEEINKKLGGNYARPKDISTIELKVPKIFKNNLVPLMASLENMYVTPDSRAKVVVDEKTGTIVIGWDVKISPVAIAQGNLQVVVKETPEVSQPAPFSLGLTTGVPRTQLKAKEEIKKLNMVKGASLKELVDGLNAIGATPRDLISILRTLKAAGALHAELEVY
jgi:flagellar P-ring protein precursor FlgI